MSIVERNALRELRSSLHYHEQRGVSNVTGFLPAIVPSRKLQTSFQYISKTLREIPAYFSPGRLGVRRIIDEMCSMPPKHGRKDLDRLEDPEIVDLYVATTVLAQSYRWDRCPPEPDEFKRKNIELPSGLAVPWLYCASRLGLLPSNTYFGVIGANWTVPACAGQRLGDDIYPTELLWNWLESPFSSQLEEFVLTFVEMELRGARGLQCFGPAIDALLSNKITELEYSFDQIHSSIVAMKQAFNQRIKDRLIPIQNWKNVIHIPFAWGIRYRSNVQLEGASGMQLGAVAAISAFLGVKQVSVLGAAAVSSRKYMLPVQRDYLDVLDVVGSLFAKSLPIRVHSIYKQCLQALLNWRISHRNRGVRYLKKPNSLPDIATGMTIDSSENVVTQFLSHMNDRIRETKEAGMKYAVLEFVKWQSADGVSDEVMIEAVEAFTQDLKRLPGFIHQALYKQEGGCWLDVYYWETEDDAKKSNDRVQQFSTFTGLIELIAPGSVTIEILQPLQLSGILTVQ